MMEHDEACAPVRGGCCESDEGREQRVGKICARRGGGAAGCGRGVKMCQKRVAKVPKEQDRAGCSMML